MASTTRPKMPPYLLLLVVTFTLLGILGFQAFKERRSLSDLIKDLESKTQNLEEELQTERSKIFELQRELKRSNLHQERLNKQLLELGQIKDSVEDERKRLESTLQDKDNDIVYLKEKLRILDEREEEIKVLKKKLAYKLSNITSDNHDPSMGTKTSDNTEERENKDPEQEKAVIENEGNKGDRENSHEVTQVSSNLDTERNVDKMEDKTSNNGAEAGEAERNEDDETEDQLHVDNGLVEKSDLEDT